MYGSWLPSNALDFKMVVSAVAQLGWMHMPEMAHRDVNSTVRIFAGNAWQGIVAIQTNIQYMTSFLRQFRQAMWLMVCRAGDFYRILTEPEHNMIRQQQALLETEGIDLVFTDTAVHEVARVAEEINQHVDNIGARRLYTILERIVEDISFNAPDKVSLLLQIFRGIRVAGYVA